MKPVLILIDANTNQSISIRKYIEPQFQNPWHFHKELELVLIQKGSGTSFVGDHIDHFEPGNLLLLGNNLPHMMKNNIDQNSQGEVLNAEAIVIHFTEHFLGKDIQHVPEMRSVMKILDRSKRGIKVSEEITTKIAKLMEKMLEQSPFYRIMELIKILYLIAEDSKLKLLSGTSFIENISKTQNRKLDRVYEFVMNRFNSSISLDEISDIAHMNKTAFCKYFKDRTQKTFVQFLTEIRINYAKRLLMQGDRQISEVGYECGFNNISNFNRQFRRFTGITPSSFQIKHNIKS